MKIIGMKDLNDLIDEIRKSKLLKSSKQVQELHDKLSTLEREIHSQELENVRREKEEQDRLQKEAEAHVKEVTSMELPLDWENVFNSDERAQGIHADSISDGLIISLSKMGCVDIEYISAITGEEYKDVISALKGSIYQNPLTWGECFFKGWETAEEYLSGNLMKKWHEARKASKEYDGYFDENVRAIEKVLPNTISTTDIYITLGSPWVPTDVIDDFIEHLFGKLPYVRYWSDEYIKQRLGVKHDVETGSWEIPEKSRYGHNVSVTNTYGTSRVEALHIIEKTLNMKTVVVYDTIDCPSNVSGEKKVINQEETVSALEKQKKLIEVFQKWVWSDPKRKERLQIIFENQYASIRRRIFDGSFLELKNMAPDIQLYPYQKDAVARILFSKNTLLAHDVGAGKTYTMIAAGMEMKRMGMSQKNLYVVPNNIVGQWENIFKTMYPEANVFCVEPRSFKPEKREDVLKKIRDENFDGIIMAYSCFEQIIVSREFYEAELKAEQQQIKDILSDKSKKTSKLERKQKKIDEALSNILWTMKSTRDAICFDELGITRLFVDEAHNYKNVPLDTQIDKVLGINKKGSKKCQDMLDKVHIVQKQNNGGGVIMATGTPITNSITDAFVFQKYLQDGELAMMDLQHFDSWIGMFAERTTSFEVDVDTSNYRMATRFTKFHNLPELTAMLSSIADFHQVDKGVGIPDFEGYRDCLLGKTDEFAQYLAEISLRTEDVRNGIVSRKEDNMLKITTDGRKAALDMRLVDSGALFTLQSKVVRCAENVMKYYMDTYLDRCTQLVFCDTSTPKSGFNLYTELKDMLVKYGVPEEEIAFIHDATSEKQKALLLSKVRKGEIRILIGSTFKLGLGVNVQDKLIALHHLDVPWRPADMVQREGRILRQGNQNEKVYICRYITEGSFDAYSWQLLETKQRFIADLLSGSVTERTGTDIEDTVLNYAEVKALAVGNPLIKERVEVANELSKHLMLQRNLLESKILLQKKLDELPGKIASQKEKIQIAIRDSRFYDEEKKEWGDEERKELRKTIYQAVQENLFTIREEELLEYQGFKVVLPANMMKEKPFVWLTHEGKYYVELGDSEVGTLIRIDNFLDGFEKHIKKMYGGLQKLEENKRMIEMELDKKEDYAEQIEELRMKLEKIDKKLGVKAA